MGPCQTLGLGVPATCVGRHLLASTGQRTSLGVDGRRQQGNTQDPSGTSGPTPYGRGSQGHCTHTRTAGEQSEVGFKIAAKEKKAQTNRRPRPPKASKRRRRRRKRRQRKGWRKWFQTKVFQLEQWYTTRRIAISSTNLCPEGATSSSMHSLRICRGISQRIAQRPQG